LFFLFVNKVQFLLVLNIWYSIIFCLWDREKDCGAIWWWSLFRQFRKLSWNLTFTKWCPWRRREKESFEQRPCKNHFSMKAVSPIRKNKKEIWGGVFVTIKTPPQNRIAFCGILLKQYLTEIWRNKDWIEIIMPISYSWHEVNTNWAAKKNRNELRSFRQFRKRCLRSRHHFRRAAADAPRPNNNTQVCYRGLGLLRLSGWRKALYSDFLR